MFTDLHKTCSSYFWTRKTIGTWLTITSR